MSFTEDIIVSDDKDMMTIAGKHYQKGELIEVSDRQAMLNFTLRFSRGTRWTTTKVVAVSAQ